MSYTNHNFYDQACPPFPHVLNMILCVSFQFRWFTVEVIREMDNNIRLDRDYISVSEGQRRSVHNKVKEGLEQNDKQLSHNYFQEWRVKLITAGRE